MKTRRSHLDQASAPKRTITLEAAAMAALFALAGIALFATPIPAIATDEVTITGWLKADEEPLADAVVVVELDDRFCLESLLSANGQFEFTLPVGAKARLLFQKPGYKTKEVLVDTRNALNTATARHANKTVEFAVILESLEERQQESYIGPVGYIHFVNGTGIMRVRHDERTVPTTAEPGLKRE
jgi:hypothetical protein